LVDDQSEGDKSINATIALVELRDLVREKMKDEKEIADNKGGINQ